MTADEFRDMALGLPEAVEQSHMGHPDFRVKGKIFASLGPDGDWGMAKLTPQQQAEFMAHSPPSFRPARGAWGVKGATIVPLESAPPATVRRALAAAWRNTAPKRLAAAHDTD